MTTVTATARRYRTPVLVSLVVLVSVAAFALLSGRAVTSASLDPDNPDRAGAQALRRVLEQQGVDVVVVRSAAAFDQQAIDADTTVLVTSAGALGGSLAEQVRERSRPGTLVVAEPGPSVARALDTLEGTPSYIGNGLLAQCDDPLFAGLRIDGLQGTSYPSPQGCFPGDGGFLLAQPDRGLTLLGAPAILTNGAITDADNAAVALRLLGGHDRLVWYRPRPGGRRRRRSARRRRAGARLGRAGVVASRPGCAVGQVPPAATGTADREQDPQRLPPLVNLGRPAPGRGGAAAGRQLRGRIGPPGGGRRRGGGDLPLDPRRGRAGGASTVSSCPAASATRTASAPAPWRPRIRCCEVLLRGGRPAASPILGICNGCQVLVEAGLVPGIEPGAVEVALAANRVPGPARLLLRAGWAWRRSPRGRCAVRRRPGRLVPAAHGPRRGALHPRGPGVLRPAGATRATWPCATSAAWAGGAERQPQRLAARRGGPDQRRRQRAGHDAAPRAGGRSCAWCPRTCPTPGAGPAGPAAGRRGGSEAAGPGMLPAAPAGGAMLTGRSRCRPRRLPWRTTTMSQTTLLTSHKGVDLHAATAVRVMQRAPRGRRRACARLHRCELHTFWGEADGRRILDRLLEIGRFFNPNKHHYGHFETGRGRPPWLGDARRRARWRRPGPASCGAPTCDAGRRRRSSTTACWAAPAAGRRRGRGRRGLSRWARPVPCSPACSGAWCLRGDAARRRRVWPIAWR